MYSNQTNIYDLGYIYFSVSKEQEDFMNRKIDNLFAKSYFLGACNFIGKFIYFLFHSPYNFRCEYRMENGILIYGESINNKNTLVPIVKHLDIKRVIPIMERDSFPNWRAYWYAMPHLCALCREISRAKLEHRSIIKKFFPKFWRMYGYPRLFAEMLDYYTPSIVVMANDHLPINRCLMNEANKRGIPTLYVQHAAITEKFPPLQFSYSLLDGEDSFRKYDSKKGNSGQIYLTGGIRFDVIKNFPRQEPTIMTVGLAINLVDSAQKVKETCVALKEKMSGDGVIVLRPHPQMDLNYWRKWSEEHGIVFSDAIKEPSLRFISHITVLVSNQSSIHLDAAMSRVPSIVFGLSDVDLKDHYAFVKRGLVPEAKNMDELYALIENVNEYCYDEDVVKYYNCSYKTRFEQHVSEMMADLIYHISDNTVEEFNTKYGFVKIDSSEFREVYKAC